MTTSPRKIIAAAVTLGFIAFGTTACSLVDMPDKTKKNVTSEIEARGFTDVRYMGRTAGREDGTKFTARLDNCRLNISYDEINKTMSLPSSVALAEKFAESNPDFQGPESSLVNAPLIRKHAAALGLESCLNK